MNNVKELKDSIRSFSVEFKKSKNDLCVPVVNNIHLHSIYNPLREAEKILAPHSENIIKNNRHLVFGLGFGYHIEKLAEDLAFSHDHPTIVVIEPNRRIYEEFLKGGRKLPNFVTILCQDSVEELFQNNNLVQFMVQRPALFAHPASFSLYSEFFKAFMGYEAVNTTAHIVNKCEDETFRKVINRLDQDQTLYEAIVSYKNNQDNLEAEDFLLLALEKIGSKSKGVTL